MAKKTWYVRDTGLIVAVLLLAALVSRGCALYYTEAFVEEDTTGRARYAATVLSADVATLAWDAPSPDVRAYRLYFRIHGEEDWVLVDTIAPSPNPQYSLQYTDFGEGEYDFGVIAEYDSEDSPMHTSLDESADPETGWYLRWKQ